MSRLNFKVFIVDAFSTRVFQGNQAGVVLLDDDLDFPSDILMRSIAAELKHSETAFVKRKDRDVFWIRYFTPVEEVDLCGHATIGAFQVLVDENIISDGTFRLQTKAGEIMVAYYQGDIWMEMAAPKVVRSFSFEEASELYQAYGLCLDDMPEAMLPEVVCTGLNDIMLPVRTCDNLNRASQNVAKVTQLSKKYAVVGVHMFTLDTKGQNRAECRNFAPLVGIEEEAATGTANGALTFYLFQKGYITAGEVNAFLQGEVMGNPSVVKSKLILTDEGVPQIWIGGTAVISLKGEMRMDIDLPTTDRGEGVGDED